MLDLSYLTEEEQRAILKVLKRDADLKQKEEDRCKILKKEVEDEKKLKVLTGEWFYEVKGKRHDDRLHGSDLVRASMRKGKSAPRPGDRGKAHSRDREDKENKHKSLQLEDCIANESSAGPTEAGAPRPSKRSEGLRSTSKSSLNQTPALGGTSASKEQGTSSSTKNSSFESDEVENESNVKPADAESKPQTLAALAKLIDATDVAEVQTLLNVDVAPVAGADVSSGVPEAKPITKGSTESTKSGLGERAAAVAVAAAAPPVPRARTARPEVNGRELEETVKPSARQTPVKSAVKWGGDARPPPEPAEQNGAGDVSGVKRRPAVKLSGSLDSLIDESEDGAGPRGILKHSSMSSSDSSLDTPPKSRLTKAISDVHLTPEVMHEKSKSANEDSQGSTEDLEGRHVRFNSNIQQVEVETDFNSPGYTGEGNLDNSDESNSSEEEEEDEEEDKETEENTLKNAGTSSTNPFMNDEMAGDDLFKDFGMDDPAYKSNPFTNQFVEEPEHDLPSLNRHLKTAASDDFWAEDAELELPQSLDPAVSQRQPKVNNKSEDLLDDDSENEISSLKFASMQKQPKYAVSNLKDGTNENQLPSLKSTSVQMQPKIARSADLLAEDDENELPYSEPAGLRKPAKPDMKDDTGSTVQERVPTDSSKKPRQDGRTEIQKPPPSSTERSRHGDPDADDNSDGDDDNDEQRRIDRAGGDRQKKFAAEPLKEPSQQAIDDTGAVPSLDSDEEGWQSKMPTAQSQTSSLERTGKPKSLQYPSEPSAKTNIQASDGQQKGKSLDATAEKASDSAFPPKADSHKDSTKSGSRKSSKHSVSSPTDESNSRVMDWLLQSEDVQRYQMFVPGPVMVKEELPQEAPKKPPRQVELKTQDANAEEEEEQLKVAAVAGVQQTLPPGAAAAATTSAAAATRMGPKGRGVGDGLSLEKQKPGKRDVDDFTRSDVDAAADEDEDVFANKSSRRSADVKRKLAPDAEKVHPKVRGDGELTMVKAKAGETVPEPTSVDLKTHSRDSDRNKPVELLVDVKPKPLPGSTKIDAKSKGDDDLTVKTAKSGKTDPELKYTDLNIQSRDSDHNKPAELLVDVKSKALPSSTKMDTKSKGDDDLTVKKAKFGKTDPELKSTDLNIQSRDSDHNKPAELLVDVKSKALPSSTKMDTKSKGDDDLTVKTAKAGKTDRGEVKPNDTDTGPQGGDSDGKKSAELLVDVKQKPSPDSSKVDGKNQGDGDLTVKKSKSGKTDPELKSTDLSIQNRDSDHNKPAELLVDVKSKASPSSTKMDTKSRGDGDVTVKTAKAGKTDPFELKFTGVHAQNRDSDGNKPAELLADVKQKPSPDGVKLEAKNKDDGVLTAKKTKVGKTDVGKLKPNHAETDAQPGDSDHNIKDIKHTGPSDDVKMGLKNKHGDSNAEKTKLEKSRKNASDNSMFMDVDTFTQPDESTDGEPADATNKNKFVISSSKAASSAKLHGETIFPDKQRLSVKDMKDHWEKANRSDKGNITTATAAGYVKDHLNVSDSDTAINDGAEESGATASVEKNDAKLFSREKISPEKSRMNIDEAAYQVEQSKQPKPKCSSESVDLSTPAKPMSAGEKEGVEPGKESGRPGRASLQRQTSSESEASSAGDGPDGSFKIFSGRQRMKDGSQELHGRSTKFKDLHDFWTKDTKERKKVKGDLYDEEDRKPKSPTGAPSPQSVDSPASIKSATKSTNGTVEVGNVSPQKMHKQPPASALESKDQRAEQGKQQNTSSDRPESESGRQGELSREPSKSQKEAEKQLVEKAVPAEQETSVSPDKTRVKSGPRTKTELPAKIGAELSLKNVVLSPNTDERQRLEERAQELEEQDPGVQLKPQKTVESSQTTTANRAKTEKKPMAKEPSERVRLPFGTEAKPDVKERIQDLFECDPADDIPAEQERSRKASEPGSAIKKTVKQTKPAKGESFEKKSLPANDENLFDFNTSVQLPDVSSIKPSSQTSSELESPKGKPERAEKPVAKDKLEKDSTPRRVGPLSFKTRVHQRVETSSSSPSNRRPVQGKTTGAPIVEEPTPVKKLEKSSRLIEKDPWKNESPEELQSFEARGKKLVESNKLVPEKPFESLKIPLEVEARREFKMKVQELIKNDPPVVEPRKEKTPAKAVVDKKRVPQRKDEDLLDFDSSEQEPEEEQPTVAASPPTQTEPEDVPKKAKMTEKPVKEKPFESLKIPLEVEARREFKMKVQELVKNDPPVVEPRKEKTPAKPVVEKKRVPQRKDEDLLDFDSSEQEPEKEQPTVAASPPTQTEPEDVPKKAKMTEKPVKEKPFESLKIPLEVEARREFKMKVQELVKNDPPVVEPRKEKTPAKPVVEKKRVPQRKDEDLLDFDSSEQEPEKEKPTVAASPPTQTEPEDVPKKAKMTEKPIKEKPFESLKIPLEVEARREFKMKVQELVKNDPPVVEPRKEKTPAKPVVEKKRVPQRKDEDLLDFDSSEQEPEKEQPTVAASPPTQTEPEDVPKKAKMTEKPVKEKPFESLKIPLEVEARREFKMKVQELVKNDPPIVEPRKEKTPAKPVVEKKRVPQRKDEDLLDFDSSEQEPEKEQPTAAASPPTQTEPQDVPKKAKTTDKPVPEKPFKSLKIPLEVEARREFKMKVQELVKNDPPVVEPRKEKTLAKPVVEKKRVPQRKDEDLLDFDSSEQEPEKEQPTVAASPPTQTEPQDVPNKAKMTDKPVKEKPFESLKIPLEVEARREFKMKVQELVKNDPPVVEPRKEKTPAKAVVDKKRVPQRKDEDVLDFDSSEQEPAEEKPTAAASSPTQTEPEDVPKKAKVTDKPVSEKPFQSLKIPLEVEARREFKMKVQELVKNDPPVVEPRKEKTSAKPVVEKKQVSQRKDEDVLDFDSSEQEPEEEQPTASPPTQVKDVLKDSDNTYNKKHPDRPQDLNKRDPFAEAEQEVELEQSHSPPVEASDLFLKMKDLPKGRRLPDKTRQDPEDNSEKHNIQLLKGRPHELARINSDDDSFEKPSKIQSKDVRDAPPQPPRRPVEKRKEKAAMPPKSSDEETLPQRAKEQVKHGHKAADPRALSEEDKEPPSPVPEKRRPKEPSSADVTVAQNRPQGRQKSLPETTDQEATWSDDPEIGQMNRKEEVGSANAELSQSTPAIYTEINPAEKASSEERPHKEPMSKQSKENIYEDPQGEDDDEVPSLPPRQGKLAGRNPSLDVKEVVARSAVSPQVERWLEDATAAATLPAAARSARAGELTDAERKKQMSRSVPVLTVSGEEGEQGIDIDSEDSGSFKLRRAPSDISSISGSMMSLYSDAGDYGNVDVKGEVNFALKYDDRRSELHVCVAQCRDLAAAVAKKGRSDPYVKTYLLPDKSRQSKKKTGIRKNNLNPVYNEILKYKIPARELQSRVLNLSVWHNDKFGKNSFLGEVEMELSTWDWGNTAYNWFDLQPRVHISQEDLTSRGYLNLALKFIPANSVGQFTPASGEIHIWVKEAKNLLPLKPHGVDAFVKCYILPDLSRKSRQKTRTVKKSMNPVFNHTMVYDGFQDEDMHEACVELTVWDQETFSNQFLGGLRLGLGGGMSYGKPVDWMDSREGEVAVWHNMITRPGEWTEALLPLRPDMVKSKAKK